MAIGSSNVPLRCEREGRGEVPSRPAMRNVAPETEAALHLWLAVWLCSVVNDHEDFKLWFVMPPLLP